MTSLKPDSAGLVERLISRLACIPIIDGSCAVSPSDRDLMWNTLVSNAMLIEELLAERRRMWCRACGTVSNNGRCDCTRSGQDCRNVADYADILQEGIEQIQADLVAAESEVSALKQDIERMKRDDFMDDFLAAPVNVKGE